MKGFEINVGDRKICASIDKGVTSVILSYAHEQFSLHIGGVNSNTECHVEWEGRKTLSVGEKITIKVVEIEQLSPLINSYPIDRKELLGKYKSLKKTLIEEGLI